MTTHKVIRMELLGRGAHTNPRHGSNILELASVLAGEPWSTSPETVHPALAAAADTVNDLMTDDRRRLLTPLAPWLPGTNSADPRIWPAVASACIRAVTAVVPAPGQPRLLADLDRARTWLASINPPPGTRRRGNRARHRDRRWAVRASRSALAQATASANPQDADTALCQALVDCVNECRRLAGKRAVDPRLPLADCPRHLLVQPRAMWSPGCDWIQQAYQLADIPQPALVPNTPAHHAPGQSPAAA
jgi:hypothetical protein